jgi:dipeptide/tripeptide permease
MYCGLGTTGYAITYFMPTVLLEFGWTAQTAQWRTVPVYAVAFVGMLAIAWLSDRLRQRFAFVLLGAVIAAVGYIMMLAQAHLSRDAKYAAVFLITLGGYSCTPIALAWLANNVSGRWKRAFSSSIQVMLGNVAGIVASNIFLTWESPRYPTGYGTAFGLLWLGVIASAVLFIALRRENRLRDGGRRDGRLSQPRQEVENMGDFHPSFRFVL